MRAHLAFITLAACLGGCGSFSPALRLSSSQTGFASWSFVVEDPSHAAQILIDGRPRVDGCRRAGRMLRCELRGLFPGGHILELRIAGGVLRRTALTGPDWAARPLLVRARDVATVSGAAHAGADGVLIPLAMEPIAIDELVEAAHKGGIRILFEAPAEMPKGTLSLGERIERYGLDGVVGAALDPDTLRRFPSLRAFVIDGVASEAIAANVRGEALALDKLTQGTGLVDAKGVLGVGLALIANRAAIADGTSFTLLGVRKRHKALREGTATSLVDDGLRRAIRMQAGGDAVTLVANAGKEPFTPTVELPPGPIDLLGGPMSNTGPTVPPGDLAAILASP